jgi:glycosyltransferase involved in cell wall biosynthesis
VSARTILCVRSIDGGLLGPEHLILTLAGELRQRGIRVVLANIWDGRPRRIELHDEACRRGIESYVLRQGWGTDPRVCLRLLNLVRDILPDVLYTHDPKSELSALLATRLRPTPLIGGYYGRLAIHSWRIKAQEATSSISFRFFGRVLANSEAQARELEEWHLPAARVTVLPSFVDTRAVQSPSPAQVAAARKALGVPSTRPVLTTVARLSAQKGHIYMLRALRDIRQVVPNVLYLVVGDAEADWHGEGMRQRLEREVVELGLTDAVQFLGQRDDLATILHATDVLVSPSLREGMSVILLDAMSAGLPIVATTVGGSPEVVCDGRTGMLVPPADAAALTRALSGLLVDADRRRALGAAGRRRVEERFATRVAADRFLDVCHEVIARA